MIGCGLGLEVFSEKIFQGCGEPEVLVMRYSGEVVVQELHVIHDNDREFPVCKIRGVMVRSVQGACRRVRIDPGRLRQGKEILQKESTMLEFSSDLVRVLGRDVRIRILYLLLRMGELCPCDLGDILGMSVQAVSDHLTRLRDRGVVRTRREGTTIYYSLRPEWLGVLRAFFRMAKQSLQKLQIAQP